MLQEIKAVNLSLPLNLGSVNSYLLKTDNGYFLIDTGYSNSRASLVNMLKTAGCNRSNLKLIILTHGDFDHVSNAAYLRQDFGVKIAMHSLDSGMVERGDMFWSRDANRLIKILGRVMSLIPPFRLNKSNRFKPDLLIDDDFSLLDYGLDARVLSIPGHSKGSLGVLTAGGDLFCGDLLVNGEKPTLNSIIDNYENADASVKKLQAMKISIVYPGHGNPFPLEALITKR